MSLPIDFASTMLISQRLGDIPNAAPLRDVLTLSPLLRGNAAAQLVFNMRTADEIAEVLKTRAALEEKLKNASGQNANLNKEIEKLKAELAEKDTKLKGLERDSETEKNRLLKHLVILEHPKISSQAIVGQKLTAAWGEYEGSQKDSKKTRSWVVEGKPQPIGDEFTPDVKKMGKEVFLREEFQTQMGKVTVDSQPMTIAAP
ncbi:MAG: hypothetical protein ACR2IG_14780 [Roseomonas sp.]